MKPEIVAGIKTTMGIEGLPKSSQGRAVIAFEGLVDFLQEPLWHLYLEYTPQGKLLTDFSDSLQLGDGWTKEGIIQDLREKLGADYVGTGSHDVLDFDLFKGTVNRRREFTYTQRLTTYHSLVIPEPATVILLGTGLIVIAVVSRRKKKP